MREFPRYQGNPKLLSPLSLAFLGDVVYELLVRDSLLENGSCPVKKLHQRSVELVRASAQAQGYYAIQPMLEEDELDILRRGRNAGVHRVPKGASVDEYHKATAVEALFGYLYLQSRMDRIQQLFEQIENTLQQQETERK